MSVPDQLAEASGSIGVVILLDALQCRDWWTHAMAHAAEAEMMVDPR